MFNSPLPMAETILHSRAFVRHAPAQVSNTMTTRSRITGSIELSNQECRASHALLRGLGLKDRPCPQRQQRLADPAGQRVVHQPVEIGLKGFSHWISPGRAHRLHATPSLR
ncbi:MAG: hypothetical protein R6V61_00885 [Wenzhouxiangellaceae bacterium]